MGIVSTGSRAPLWSERVIKWSVLWVYYSALSSLGLYWVRDWIFAVSVLYRHFVLNAKHIPSVRERVIHAVFDVMQFVTFTRVLYVYLVESYLFLLPLGITVYFLGTEYARHLLLEPEANYRVEVSTRIQDQLLPVFTMVVYACASYGSYRLQVGGQDFLMFLLCAMVFDFLFTVMHYTLHRNKAAWQMHKKHHEYKLEELNAFANFYAELSDSIIMNLGGVGSVLLLVMLGGNQVAFGELAVSAFMTHNRFTLESNNLALFFEYDVVDELLGWHKMSAWHNDHHRTVHKRYSVYGFFSDEEINDYVGPVLSKVVTLDMRG